jgi:hypothetical protein
LLISQLAQNNIKSVEITNRPPYDAEGAAVININTSKGISLGYKDPSTAVMKLMMSTKYQIGTSKFYKIMGEYLCKLTNNP